MSKASSNLRAFPLLIISVAFFIGYVVNIIFGVLTYQYGMSLPFFEGLGEFFLLALASVGLVVFVLHNESPESHAESDADEALVEHL